MTGSDLLLDAWAWVEIFRGSQQGVALRRRWFIPARYRLHTSAITVAELGAKLAQDGEAGRIPAIVAAIRAAGRIHDVVTDIAQKAGPLRLRLRETDSSASLADALVLATARTIGARILTRDPAFRDQPEVVPI